jgi:hypothetical protein
MVQNRLCSFFVFPPLLSSSTQPPLSDVSRSRHSCITLHYPLSPLVLTMAVSYDDFVTWFPTAWTAAGTIMSFVSLVVSLCVWRWPNVSPPPPSPPPPSPLGTILAATTDLQLVRDNVHALRNALAAAGQPDAERFGMLIEGVMTELGQVAARIRELQILRTELMNVAQRSLEVQQEILAEFREARQQRRDGQPSSTGLFGRAQAEVLARDRIRRFFPSAFQ